MNQQQIILDSVNKVIKASSEQKAEQKAEQKVEKTITPCTLEISTKKLNYTKVLETIESFKAEQGWIATQSQNISFITKEDAQACTKTLKTGGVGTGKLLSAELTKKRNDKQGKATQSMTIRHHYAEEWQVTTFIESEQGEDYLCDTIKHYATSDLRKLSYQRLWQETDQGYEPCASYFTGFIVEEGQEE